MTRKLLFVSIAILFSVLTWGQAFQYFPDKFYQQITSSSIVSNPNFSGNTYNDPLPFTTHDKWQDAVNGTSFTFKSVQDFVRVGIRRDIGVVTGDYDYNVAVQIKCYNPVANFDINTTPPVNTITTIIPISYHPASMANYNDLSVFKFSGYQGIRVFVTGIYDKSNPSVALTRASLPQNFYIESDVEVQRADLGTIGVTPNAYIDNGSVFVNWPPSGIQNPKPAQYDLEWLYVDDYHLTDFTNGNFTTNFSSSSNVNYDFRKNSTRVRVSNTNYRIPLIYEHGAIVYRVRAVQPALNTNYKDIAYGAWSLPDFGMANCSNGAQAIWISDAHMHDSLNWQYTINFAEDGKYKHVINYFDGSLKGRQTQTKINTDDSYIIALDKIYDYEGRPGIQTLPVPVSQTNLSYRKDVTLNNSTGEPYVAADFDNGCIDPRPGAIAPLKSTAMANVYYSPLNSDQAGMQKYVPDAHGYPFVETIYSPDNTNKVLVQGGAGSDHQPSTGHVTKYEYVRANQAEIDRLLGTEAGISEFYPKQVITDPNGQTSFSIVNHGGKVVATGLSGSIDGTDKPIDLLDNFIPGSVVCNDLLHNVTQQMLDDRIVAENAFYVDNGGASSSVQYNASILPFPTGCSGKYLNAAGTFTVRVTDECGTPYMNTAGHTTADSGVVGSYTVTTSANAVDTQTAPVSSNLGKGKYLVKKELSFSAKEIKNEVNQFVWANEPTCYHDSLYFIRNSVEAAKFPCVDSGATNMCDQRRKEMIKELWPGAKYGLYNKNPDSTFAAGENNSIFTASVIFNDPPATSPPSQVVNGNTVTITRNVNPISAIGGGSRSSIYSCNNTDPVTGACNCGIGVHNDRIYCCEECLLKHCQCITFITYDVTETTTVDYPAVNCNIAAQASAPGFFSQCQTSTCDFHTYPGWPTTDCFPYTQPPVGYPAQPAAVAARTVPCSLLPNVYHQVWLMSLSGLTNSSECVPYSTDGASFMIFYDNVHSVTPTPTVSTTSYSVPDFASVGYRYQSPCVTLAQPITINGVKYTSLADVDPQALIDNFSDTIAEALLPLHPEYCKMLACNDGPFEERLENTNTWQQAEPARLFLLDDMITNDPMYINATASAKPGLYNKLAYLQGNMSDDPIDVMAIKRAYCGAGNIGTLVDCATDLYSSQISHFDFINDAVKQKYFEILKGLYMGNREYLKQQGLDKTGNSCGPCYANKMTLTGNPIFPQVFDATTGEMSTSLTGMPSWMTDLFTQGQTVDLTGSLDPPAGLLDSMNAIKDNQNKAIVTNVISKLQNCSVVAGGNNATALTALAADLTAYLAAGNKLTPLELRNRMFSAGLNIDDLCHPFLTAYDIYDAPADVAQTYSCASDAFYADMTALIDYGPIKEAIRMAGPNGAYQYSLDLNALPGNRLAAKIQQYFFSVTGVQPTQVSVQGFTAIGYHYANSHAVGFKYVKLKMLPDMGSVPAGSELYFYIKGRSEPYPGSPRSPDLDFTTSINIAGTFCLNKDAVAMNDGYVAGNTAVMLASINGGSDIDSYYVWNNQIPFMEAVSDASLIKAITCPEIKMALQAFQGEQSNWGYDIAANHPLYEQTLTNYLNVYFNKQYSYFNKQYTFDDYYALMNGCAVTDQLSIGRHSATARVHVSSAQLSSFMTAVAGFTDRELIDYKVGIAGAYDLYIDMNTIPDDSLGWYKAHLLSAAPSGSIHFMEDKGMLVFALNDLGSTNTPTLSSSLVSINATITQTDQVTVEENGMPVNYTLYTCTPHGSDPYNQSQSIESMKALLTGFNAFVFYNGEFLRSSDYHTTAKQDYLNYVYGLGGDHDAIIAAIDPAIVKTATTELTADFTPFSTLTYQDPYCTGTKTDLYAYGPNNGSHPGLQRLTFILSYVDKNTSPNPHDRLFPNTLFKYASSGGSSWPALGPTGLAIAHKANGTYWYRYFDNNTNRMYNVYITPPADITNLSSYSVSNYSTDITVAQGDDSVKRFNIVLRNGSDIITCSGYTDFPIGYSQRLQNVVLFKDAYKTVCFDSTDCERDHLTAAIQSGLANYYQYFDSLTNDMSGRMMAWMLSNSKDTLILCTQDQKYQYTLYYYDRAGNLTRTVPPAGVSVLPPAQLPAVDANRANTSSSVNGASLTSHKKTSYYQYNSLNQLVYQQTPDGGITYFFYDAVGRLVFSQNSKQRPSGKYSYTLYDDQSRVMETGEAALGCTLPDNPNVLFDNTPCSFANPSGSGTVTSVHPPYVGSADLFTMDVLREYVRAKNRTDVVVTVYDTAVVDLGVIAGEHLSTQENLRKRVAAIFYFKMLGNTTNTPLGQSIWLAAAKSPDFGTYYSYDMLGNVKTVSYNCQRFTALKQQYKRVDYDYDLLSGKVNMVSYNRNRPDQFYHKYEYDADNRITKATTSNDGVIWNTDARYAYYKHGPLATAKIGDNMIQSLEYAYTIQGWLKAINGDVLSPQKEMGQNGLTNDLTYARDAMAHTLDYFQNDYGAIGGSGAPIINLPSPTSTQNLWNGNIVRQTTAVSGLGNMQRSYRYDQLQRLKLAQNAMVDEAALTVANPSDIYKSNYSYDPDGNIKTLQRWSGSATGAGTMPNIDNFTYNYTAGGNDNKLQYVADAVSATGGTDLQPGQSTNNYQYDKIGNLVKDAQGNLTIDWNLYGKVKMITDASTPNRVITFDYDGSGNRVFKEVVIKNSATSEDHKGEYYVHDASGNILSVYKTHSNYNPTQIIYNTNVDVKADLGQTSLLTPILVDAVGSSPGFSSSLQTQALADMPTWVQGQTSTRTAGGYMQLDGDIFTRMVYSGTSYLSALRTVDLARSPITSGIIPQAFLNKGVSYVSPYIQQMLGTVLLSTHACTILLQDFDANVPPKYTSTVWKSMGVTYKDASPAVNAQALHDFIFRSPATYAPRVATLMNTALKMALDDMPNGSYVSPFAGVFLSDNGIFNDDQLIQSGNNFYPQLRDVIYNSSPKDYISSFFDTWSQGASTLAAVTTPAQLLSIQYNLNPTGVMSSFFNTAPDMTIATAIANIPSMTTPQYVGTITAKLTSPPQDYQMLLTAVKDTIKLSEHHIYGSSRLGIQNYDTSTLRNTYDAANGSNSLFTMSAPAVWYSYPYADVIDKNYKDPWGHGDLTQWAAGRTVGKRNYELTDHLGNVLASVLDRKTGHAVGSLYDYYLADVATATDYYPGGMPMSGRSVNADKFRFGSQNQLKDDEIYGSGNSYAFKYRMEDARLNRFWSVDPLTKKYPHNSSYAFSENRLTDGIELEGAEWTLPRIGFSPWESVEGWGEITMPELYPTPPIPPAAPILPIPPDAPTSSMPHIPVHPKGGAIWEAEGSIDWNKPPLSPEDLSSDWQEITDPRNQSGSREFQNSNDPDEKVRFDPGKPGANGWEGKDHWHRYNPTSTGKKDLYLDRYGNPVPRGADVSHIGAGDNINALPNVNFDMNGKWKDYYHKKGIYNEEMKDYHKKLEEYNEKVEETKRKWYKYCEDNGLSS